LSEQIRNLEKELGTPLFSRGRRETVLAAAGETLRPHAEALIAGSQAAKLAVKELVGLKGGRLSLGSFNSRQLAVALMNRCYSPNLLSHSFHECMRRLSKAA